MKLAVVVQRYGADISGGAEYHARLIAERLARYAEVQVLTTCAQDYITWRNELQPGQSTVNGIAVRRFPVARPRNTRDFGVRSQWVFGHEHSMADELKWLRSEGPYSPALVSHLAKARNDFDFFVFFSYRYYHAFHGARAVPEKAVLVPTAERDAAAGLAIFPPLFRGVRAMMYNSPEERALIEAVSHRQGASVVVGVGSEVPERPEPARFRRAHNVTRPFAVYIGRIDENKGCREMLSHFAQYAETYPKGLDLILIGSKHMDLPEQARVRHLGFLPDRDKFDALAAADVLLMPSRYESLSMVVLEAWALGKPVLVNAECDVLHGQCLRSRAGLFYRDAQEFCEALYMLDGTGPAGAILGRQGRDYFRQHYAWPVIERKYRDMFDRLTRESSAPPVMEPLPGFLARRRRTLPPAQAVVDAAPGGPAVR